MEKQKMHQPGKILAAVCLILLAAYLLISFYLTFRDMERVANPTVYQVEEGVWNLTAKALTVRAEELGSYILYTNSTKIQVTAEVRNTEGKIGLTRIEVPDVWLMENVVNSENDSITFKNLCAADRYIVSCEGLDGTLVTVSEGVEPNFWKSFQNVQHSFWDHVMNLLHS